jgi:hypothetical protein
MAEISAKVTCPRCSSRLDVTETPSGGRSVAVLALDLAIDVHAKALERFIGPDGGPDVICPACEARFDPAAPLVRPRLRRPQFPGSA